MTNVHRLICIAFHGPPLEGQVAIHIDNDLSNNRASNLKWAYRVDSSKNPKRLLPYATRSIVVVHVDSTTVTYASYSAAAKGENLSNSRVTTLCNSGTTSKGRLFAFVKEQPYEGEVFRNITAEEVALLAVRGK